MSANMKHDWVYDGGGGGHNGEYYFTCKHCGDSDWVSYASLREGQKPNAAGCKGAKPPAPPRSPMSPEALERLRAALREADPRWHLAPDLRALLDAYDELKLAAEMDALRTENRKAVEERLIAERDEALDALAKSNQYIDEAVKRQHVRYDEAAKQHGRHDARTKLESKRLHDLINSTRNPFDSVARFLAKAGRR